MGRTGETVKRYKTLLRSAPAHSILDAQKFHYTSSVATDIRETFERIRHEGAKAAVGNVASLGRSPTPAGDTPAADL